MRRKDREITDRDAMESILHEALVCRIGMAQGSEPYVVPVCFAYRNGAIYFHSANEGRKIAILKENPRCCIEVDRFEGAIRDENPCKWEMRYRSVICAGVACFVEDPEEKREALNLILRHYKGDPRQFTEREMKPVSVIRIDIDEMTGKQHGY
jgi:hypothetical protein